MPVITAHDELLTVGEVQEILRCSRVTVYAHMKENGLPFIQLRGRRMVRRESLDDWLTANEHNSPEVDDA